MRDRVPGLAGSAGMLALVGVVSVAPAASSPYQPADATAVIQLTPRQTLDGGWRYLLPVSVGTPLQPLLLLLDTGSHQLLLRDAARGACGPADPPALGPCFNSSASTSIDWIHQSTGAGDEMTSFSYVLDVDIDLIGRYRSARDTVVLSLPGNEEGSGDDSAPAVQTFVAALDAASRGGIGPIDRVEHFWADAVGVLGASHWAQHTDHYRDGPWQSLLRLVSGETNTFALDLNRGNNSSLVLGGTYLPTDVAWSETRTAPDFHELLLFNPNVCGADLLGASSGWWLALVDLGSSCLGLPANVFTGLFRWLEPSLRECNFDLGTGEELAGEEEEPLLPTSRRCYLPRGADPEALPTLSFRLSQTGRLLQLPLSELLLPPRAALGGKREFCVRSHLSGTAGEDTAAARILIGSQALHAFYAVFQMASGQARVGLTPKLPQNASRLRLRTGCAAQPRCIGQQQYIAATNECKPPDCSERYSRFYDEGTGCCLLRPTFEAMAIVLLFGFAVFEMALQEWQTRLPRSTAEPEDAAEDSVDLPSREDPPLNVHRRQPWTPHDA